MIARVVSDKRSKSGLSETCPKTTLCLVKPRGFLSHPDLPAPASERESLASPVHPCGTLAHLDGAWKTDGFGTAHRPAAGHRDGGGHHYRRIGLCAAFGNQPARAERGGRSVSVGGVS